MAAAAALLMPGLATGCCRSRRVRPSSAATHIVLGLLSRGLWGRGGGQHRVCWLIIEGPVGKGRGVAWGMLAYHPGACVWRGGGSSWQHLETPLSAHLVG